MTPYYDGKRYRYSVDGQERVMTEEEAEKYQEEHPRADVQADLKKDAPLPDGAADDYLECTCLPDPPDGNVTATLCNACRAYFDSLETS